MVIVFIFTILLLMIYDYISNKQVIYISKAREYGFIIIWYSIIVLLFMAQTGVLDSGYHFVDDHDVYGIRASFTEYGFWRTMFRMIRSDLDIRFRFTYWIIRVSESFFLGNNWKLWHITQSIISIFSMSFSYIFARKMHVPAWIAFIFPIAVFWGDGQTAVLWKLGPQENLGVLLLMMTLISLDNYVKNSKFCITAIILTFLLGGIKESFLILLPILPILLVIFELRDIDEEICLKKCWELFKKRRIYFFITYLFFAVDMAVIIFFVGTNIGYAGIDATFGLRDYLKAIIDICYGNRFIHTAGLEILFLLLLGLFMVAKGNIYAKTYFRYLISALLVLGYVLLTQFVLYAKSGIWERYLIPSTVGVAIFCIIDIFDIIRSEERRVGKECS